MADTDAPSSRAPRSKRRTRAGGKGNGGNANSLSETATLAAALEALDDGVFSHRLRPRDGVSRELQEAFNHLAERLEHTSTELARVARVVGRDGEIGERLRMDGLRGGWEVLGDSFNTVIGDLVRPSKEVARVILAVAEGDLSQEMALEIDGKAIRGEFLRIGTTVNRMVDQLRSFASEVTRVAREVGSEGKLGGQANVPGVAGTWKDLTDSVNGMASNLTTQVRGVVKLVTAVANGELSHQFTMDAQGEVAQLKERVNQMIANLRETTQKNREQDWLKSNLARFGGLMQGQKSLESVSHLIMSELTPLVAAAHGAFFVMDEREDAKALTLLATYACEERKRVANRFRLGEGIVGQAALEKKRILLTGVPGDYVNISSGLGAAPPLNIIVIPILFEDEVRAVVELASFEAFSAIHRIFLEQLSETIGGVLNMIGASTRTEELLAQSQSLAQELQEQSRELQEQQDQLKRSNQELEEQAHTLRASEEMLQEQQDELQQVNEALEDKASLLVEQNRAVEQKNREVELTRKAVEEKASQLALSSQYKSEFLANMSHELRTPLNSLLILARMLSDNKEQNLTAKQVEYTKTIYEAGADLLSLINEVLDLSKVEAGKIEIHSAEVSLTDIVSQIDQTFRPIATQKRLELTIDVDTDVPVTLKTDGQRVLQVLRNLLGNAFKFTDHGSVRLHVHLPAPETVLKSKALSRKPRQVVAFSVVDTGGGIPKEKQQLIFEAFQQADGTTSRKYGGTGLGLSISRELSRLLGGEVRVESELGKGSIFTLCLPYSYDPQEHGARSGLVAAEGNEPLSRGEIDDDRDGLEPHDRVVLIVEGERLLAETTRFLHRVESALPTSKRRTIEDHAGSRAIFEGKQILIVDDDVRNIYALSSVLEEAGMSVVFAENGREGIDLLKKTPGISLVLMDVMMPVMDGYEAMRLIRQMPEQKTLPVLALTAKAMKGDRDKCLAAGASDYVTKPVDPDQLLSLMRVWLYHQ